MKLRHSAFLFCCIHLAGCGSAVLVVRNPVPDAPSFTVLPSGYSNAEINFAGDIEREIVRTGLRVVERPPFKFLDSDARITEYGHSESVSSPVKLTDMVAMFPDCSSDYIVTTSANNSRVRIIKKQDRSVVATFKAQADQGTLADQVYPALVAAGFTKTGYDETACKIGPRKR